MATKSGHARSAGAVKPARAAKGKARKPEAKKPRSVRSAPKSVSSSSSTSGGGFASRDRKYSEIFGAVFPKGRVFDPTGESITSAVGAQLELCCAQYAPTPDRMSWVYVTHGISTSAGAKNKDARYELMMHSRDRDNAAARVLASAAKYILSSGNLLSPGDLISSSQISDPGLPGLQHWVVATPDKTVPEKLEQAGGAMRLILLLGVSDAEMQVALKVNPDLADGRRVLLEALRAGGVFPVTDPKRTCLTRRRDFHRLWECAFRAVRENKATP